MSVNLQSLPDILFADADTARTEARVIRAVERRTGRTLYPGDPQRLFLEGLAYALSLLRAEVDFTGKQNLLRYASGPYLEQLGVLVGVQRLGKAASLTTLRFALGSALPFAAVIPAGTRATADGTVLFASDAEVAIPAGELSVEVKATALKAGMEGNGLLPGQIRTLVDPLPFVIGVENTTASNSGSDVEDDEHLRGRIQLAPESFSTAGPQLAYTFWAMSAHPDIIDASPLGPPDADPGCVDVRVLMAGGQPPSEELLARVLAALTGARRRPLTDKVRVGAPDMVDFTLDVKWWVARSDAALLASIRTGVDAAVRGWLDWQSGAIGRDINPSELTRRMVNAGAKRVEITSPGFTALDAGQVARLQGEAGVTHAGTEAN